MKGLLLERIDETVTDVYEWMESTEEWEIKSRYFSGEREKGIG